jgi:DNA-binding response OmpR family regulator
LVVTTRGKIRQGDCRVAQLLGVDAETLIGSTLSELVVSRDLPALQRLLAYAHAAGPVFLTLDMGSGPKRFRWTATALGDDRLLSASIVVREAAMEAPVKFAKRAEVKRQERILVIESEAAKRMSILKQLEKLGFQAFVATNCSEAAEVTRRGFYDLMLLNLDLHDGEGLSILSRLRAAERKLGHRQIIVGMSQSESLLSGISDIDDWLCLPLAMTELEEVVSKWLPDGPSVDFDALREATMADDKLERHILQVYLANTVDHLQNLESAFQHGILEDARRIAHSIKGSCLTTGVVRLGEMARDLEVWLKGDGTGAAPHSIDALRNEYGRVSHLLKKRLIELSQ